MLRACNGCISAVIAARRATTVLHTQDYAAFGANSSLGVAGRSLLARLLYEAGAETIPYTAAHWPVAVDAFTRYGKGRHPAALNFGNCLTYATCRLAGRPLLCTGDDFPQTDLAVIVPPECHSASPD